MAEKTEYEKNIDKILVTIDQKNNIIGAPRSEEILKILRIRFNEIEASIGAKIYTIPEDPEAIAERLNMKEEELIPILEQMANRGTVFRVGEKGNYKYSLWPTDIGIFETSFGKGEDNEQTRELGKLWTNYYNSVWAKEFMGIKTQFTRIVAIEENIPGQQEVLPYEKVSEIIESQSYLTITNCACRSAAKLAGGKCSLNAPTYTCLHFGDIGRNFVERGFAKEISKDECHELMKKVEDMGLVHLTVNTKRECVAICSCCPCCCVALRAITQMHKPDAVAHSDYFPYIDREICDLCKNLPSPVCIDRCPMDAISLKNGRVVVNVANCIGCSICVHFCPIDGAITLKKREKVIEPKEDLVDLVTSVAQEKESYLDHS